MSTSRQVIFDRFGGPDALSVRHVEEPHAGAAQVRVRVAYAGLNPVDYKIFAGGATAERFGVTPPSGNGNDFAGVIDEVGPEVPDIAPGLAVFGGARFHAQADHIIVSDLSTLNPVPPGLDLRLAAVLDIAGRTALASVDEVGVRPGDTVLVTAAAGGVGGIAAQLAALRGAEVIGTAGPANHPYLHSLGIRPVSYGPGLEERVRAVAPGGLDAVLDNHGVENVELALRLGAPPDRVNSVADKQSAEAMGVRSAGRAVTATDAVQAVARLVASGRITVPIAAVHELDDVVSAYRTLVRGHVRGKIVLRVSDPDRPGPA